MKAFCAALAIWFIGACSSSAANALDYQERLNKFQSIERNYLNIQSGALPPAASTSAGGVNNSLMPAPLKDRSNVLTASKTAALAEEVSNQDAFFADTLKSCDGRLDSYENQAQQQAKRDENITVAGLIFGVVGSLSTVTNVARGFSALAGLAPTVVKTYKDNADSPQDTEAVLASLSKQIKDDSSAYTNLPYPVPGDANFEKNWGARQKVLLTLLVDCGAYYDKSQPTKSASHDSAEPAAPAAVPKSAQGSGAAMEDER